jgi:DNA (cytosine-5)-methyltransferase 1
MSLYQEIIFLENHFEGKFVVENVIPYYEPLIPAQKRGRHLYWTNFKLPNDINERHIQISAGTDEVKKLCNFHDYDFKKYKGEQRLDKIARNLVDYEAGLTIYNTAMGIVTSNKIEQKQLF